MTIYYLFKYIKWALYVSNNTRIYTIQLYIVGYNTTHHYFSSPSFKWWWSNIYASVQHIRNVDIKQTKWLMTCNKWPCVDLCTLQFRFAHSTKSTKERLICSFFFEGRQNIYGEFDTNSNFVHTHTKHQTPSHTSNADTYQCDNFMFVNSDKDTDWFIDTRIWYHRCL